MPQESSPLGKSTLFRDKLLDSLKHSYHFSEDLAPCFKGLKNIQWFKEVANQRIKNGYSFGHEFSLTYFVKSDFNIKEQQALCDIIDILQRDVFLYRFEEEIVCLDPENVCLGKIIVEKFNSAKTDDEKKKYAAIAGYLKDDSSAWMEISAVVCQYARKLPKKE